MREHGYARDWPKLKAQGGGPSASPGRPEAPLAPKGPRGEPPGGPTGPGGRERTEARREPGRTETEGEGA